MPVVVGPTEERDRSRVKGREATGGDGRASREVVEMDSFLADETKSDSRDEGVSKGRLSRGVLDREPDLSENTSGVEVRSDEPRSSMPTIERDLVRRSAGRSSVLSAVAWRLWFSDPLSRSCAGPGDVGRELVYE